MKPNFTLNYFRLTFIILAALSFTAVKAQVPSITSFSPTCAKKDSFVNIKGVFTGCTTANTSVKFGGSTAALFTVIGDTIIRAKLNTGATGNITVTKSGVTATASGFYFGYVLSAPTLQTPTVLNVSCGGSETYLIRKVTGAVSYTWYMNRGVNSKATITHLNGLGENDTAVLVTFLAGFTKDSVCVKAATPCSESAVKAIVPVGTYAPPTVTDITASTGDFAPCIGSTVSYTAVSSTVSVSQCPIAYYRWTIPVNTTIVSANADSSTINLRYNTEFTGGTITSKGQSGCGTLGTAKTVTLKFYPPTPSGITTSNSNLNVCPGYTVQFTAAVDSPGATQVASARIRWTLPARSSIISANSDSTIVNIKFQSNYTSASLSASAVSACGVVGTAKTVSVPTTTYGCIIGPDSIYGPQELCSRFLDFYTSDTIHYYTNPVPNAASYNWILPVGLYLLEGEGTNEIVVFADNTLSSNYGAGRLFVSAVSNLGVNSGFAELRLFRTVPILGTMSGPSSICGLIGKDTTLVYEVAPVNNISQYQWEVPAGVDVISSSLTTNRLEVKFNNNFVSGTSIKINASANCGAVSPRSITFYRPFITPPTAIRKSFVPLVATITNVAGMTRDTLRIKKIPNATRYIWTLLNGAYANITHLNGLGVYDTAIVVNILPGFTTETVSVAAATDCDNSTSISVTLSAMALPPAPNAIAGLLSPCIGETITYTASAPNPTTTQAPVGRYTWTIPANTQIISANADSSSIQLKFNTGFTGGTIGARSVSPNGVYSTLTYKSTFRYATAAPTSITSSTGVFNACIGSTITFTPVLPAFNAAQAPIVSFRWTKPNNTSIVAAASDSSNITLQFNTGYTGGTVTAKGVTRCGIFGAAKSAVLTHTGCAVGSKTFAKNSPTNSFQQEELYVTLSPNPTTSNFIINCISKSKSNISIKVFDMKGRLLKSLISTENNSISFGNDIAPGMYSIEVKQGKIYKMLKAIKL